VAVCEAAVGLNPFLVVLSDHVYRSNRPDQNCAAQLLAAFQRDMTPVIGLKESPADEVSAFGCATGVWLDAGHEALHPATVAATASSASSEEGGGAGAAPTSASDTAGAAACTTGGVPPLPASVAHDHPRLLNVTQLAEKPSVEYARRHLGGMPLLEDDVFLTVRSGRRWRCAAVGLWWGCDKGGGGAAGGVRHAELYSSPTCVLVCCPPPPRPPTAVVRHVRRQPVHLPGAAVPGARGCAVGIDGRAVLRCLQPLAGIPDPSCLHLSLAVAPAAACCADGPQHPRQRGDPVHDGTGDVASQRGAARVRAAAAAVLAAGVNAARAVTPRTVTPTSLHTLSAHPLTPTRRRSYLVDGERFDLGKPDRYFEALTAFQSRTAPAAGSPRGGAAAATVPAAAATTATGLR
jgi:hypothetical protein